MKHEGKRFEQELEELRRIRDELRVQVHLGRSEARQLWEQLEHRYAEMEGKAKVLAQRAGEPIADIAEAASLLADELRSGYYRLKELL